MVGIVTHGSTADRSAGIEAEAILRAAGIRVTRQHDAERLDFGEARNRAVALSDTEWVMHFDSDDMLMPHALGDIAALMPHGDIIALGYERSGDLAAGPKNRTKLYKSSQGKGVLENPTPCSGVSPFKRSLWERSPYRTDLIGGWDTALWIGFGHLGVKIVPTVRPCFWYRQHADSVFNTRRKSGWEAAWTGAKFTSLRRQDRGVAFLVPRMPDGGPRDRAYQWVRRRWAKLHPDWAVHEGTLAPGLWNKGRALALALEPCRAEVLILADADCIHPPEALEEAVARVRAGAPWVVPHGDVHRLSEAQTIRLLATDPGGPFAAPTEGLQRAAYKGFAGGGTVVVSRATYDAIGGMPTNFDGWGCEDETLALILDTLAGPHQRLPQPLVHLWHPPQKTRRGNDYRRNRGLMAHYLSAAGDRIAMWALVQRGATAGSDPYSNPTWRLKTHRERGQAMRQEITSNRGDFFRMRQLEQQHLRNTAAREAAAEGRRIAAAAYKAGQEARRQGRKMLTTIEHGAMAPAVENKAVLTPEPLRFASAKAEALATEHGLGPEDFAGIVPGPNGFTTAQVRGVLGD
jgi:hypothetical protein